MSVWGNIVHLELINVCLGNWRCTGTTVAVGSADGRVDLTALANAYQCPLGAEHSVASVPGLAETEES